MKIIITTSDKYLHLLPIFAYLFKKNWNEKYEVNIVGYDGMSNFIFPKFHKSPLFDNFIFHSLGKQEGNAKNFSNDLRKYFEKQDTFFIWMMEDTFIKSVNFDLLNELWLLRNNSIGRINLCSRATTLQDFYQSDLGENLLENTQTADYRLCTQPSIWNKNFLLKYLTPDLTPWEFETQKSINDGYRIIGHKKDVVDHNEGVTKHDIFDYNLNGIKEDQIEEMKKLNIL